MIVVDTNILAHFWLPSDQTDLAEHVFQFDPEWAAPILWQSEFRNVVAAYMRKSLVDYDIAVQIIQEAEQQMADTTFSVQSWQVMRLVEGSSCSAYDCEFVALAQEASIPLVTSDRQILDNFPKHAISPQQFVAGKHS